MPTYPSSRVEYSDNGADPGSWGGGGKERVAEMKNEN